MEYFKHDNEIEITGPIDFDPAKIFECGQCFRWEPDNSGVYTGVVGNRVARIRSSGESIFISCSLEDFETFWHGYFDLEHDYAEIRSRLSLDSFMRDAVEYGKGIRILHQDNWEALCSFIISQCNNIPRIKKIISALCYEFGEKLEFFGEDFYSFPSAAVIAALSPDDLSHIRCGYRAPYIINAAKAVATGDINLDALAQGTIEAARVALMKLQGVGSKVADCVLLFGFHMLDAFPLDVWMKRAVAEHFSPGFDPVVFSPYAGLAQQYIFFYTRSVSMKQK